MCGTKNFASVRWYSAPQLHRTIVAILGICAYGTPKQVETRRKLAKKEDSKPFLSTLGPKPAMSESSINHGSAKPPQIRRTLASLFPPARSPQNFGFAAEHRGPRHRGCRKFTPPAPDIQYSATARAPPRREWACLSMRRRVRKRRSLAGACLYPHNPYRRE